MLCFLVSAHRQMTRQTFWHRVKHYAILADIDADALSPHVLRHAFCHSFSESRCGFTRGANVARAYRFIHNTDLYSRGKREIETIA